MKNSDKTRDKPLITRSIYAARRLGLWPLLVLLVCFLFTYLSWNFSREALEKRDNLHFLRLLDATEEAILGRLSDFESALWAGVGYLRATPNARTENWQRFVESLQMAQFFTGSLGLGFIEHDPSPRDGKDESLHEMFPDFHLEEHSKDLGIHEYPLMAFNRDAEEKRRRAAWLAADLGRSVVSERIDFGGSSQETGFFFLAPVYWDQGPNDTLEDRRRLLRGWVFTAFTAANLFKEIGQRGLGEVMFEVFESPHFEASPPVYSSFPDAFPRRPSSLERTRTISFGNRPWLIRWRTTDLFERRALRSSPQVVLVLGFFGSLSLTLIALLIQLGRSRALIRADRAQLALKSSQEQFQLAMLGANDILWYADLRTGSVTFSERWRDLLKCEDQPSADLLSFFKNRIHPDDLSLIEQALKNHIHKKHPFKVDIRVLIEYGKYCWFVVKGQAVWDSITQEPLQMAGSISDISGRKIVEEQLKVTLQSLSRSNRELADFASVASHDLQEPLRKVQAFSTLLQEKYAHQDPQAQDITKRMVDAAARMQKLIQDLLRLAKIDTSAQCFTWVDLNLVVSEVLGDLEYRIKETKAIVHVASLPVIEAEQTQMRQLFQNLIGNALKFSSQTDQPQVFVNCQIKDTENPDGGRTSWAFIRVEDNGIGFDEQQLPRIFKVFQRLHARNVYEGSGVGLSICRRIVERHNGFISAKSQPGQGATFLVQLPTRQPHVIDSTL